VRVRYFGGGQVGPGAEATARGHGAGRVTAEAAVALHDAIVQGRLRHPNDPDLNRHIASTVAKDTPSRGVRLVRASRNVQIDGALALAQAVWVCEAMCTVVDGGFEW
jgi:hypothetical protein